MQIGLDLATNDADCLVLMVAHSAYRNLDLERLGARMRRKIVIDGRHLLRESAIAAGFTYRCVGIA